MGVDLYDDFGELSANRVAVDDDIQRWAAAITRDELAGTGSLEPVKS